MLKYVLGAAVAASMVTGAALAQGGGAPMGSTDAAKSSGDRREKEADFNKLAGQYSKKKRKGSAVPASAADIVGGAIFRDSKGQVLGRIEAVQGTEAVVLVGTRRVRMPLHAFGKDANGLLLSMSRAEFQAALPAAEAAAAAAPRAVAPAAAKMVIYDSALATGWQNRSSAAAELGVEVNGTTRRPIRVEAGQGQALRLQRAPFSTTGYRTLSLLLQGVAPGGQKLRIVTLSGGQPTGEGRVVTLGQSGWTLVEVPLVLLGAEDKMLDGISVQNASDKALPRFYVTDIALN
jgi:hypothetical protein